jgi:hypothetical protein
VKKYTTALLLWLGGSISAQVSEQAIPVKCVALPVALAAIRDHWNERPAWSGVGADSNFALFVNPDTGTWTMLEFDKDIACVLGTGDNSKLSKPWPRV